MALARSQEEEEEEEEEQGRRERKEWHRTDCPRVFEWADILLSNYVAKGPRVQLEYAFELQLS